MAIVCWERGVSGWVHARAPYCMIYESDACQSTFLHNILSRACLMWVPVQEFTASGLNFTVYPAPRLLSLSPSSGPIHGATFVRLSGVNLAKGSDYLCRYGLTIVNATLAEDSSPQEVHCLAPPQDVTGAFTVYLSLNGQNFTDSDTLFTYYLPSLLTSLSPSSGPSLGGTTVEITGQALASGSDHRVLMAREGNLTTQIVSSTPIDQSGLVMEFHTPPLAPGDVQVKTSLNGQQFSGGKGLELYIYAHPRLSSLSPSCGPVRGATAVTVTGTNFSGGTHFLCNFGLSQANNAGVRQNATLRRHWELACASPSVDTATFGTPPPHPLQISLNGQQFTSGPQQWSFHSEHFISAIYPASGATTGGVTITVMGSGFSAGCDMQCNFEASSLIVNATFDAGTGHLLCVSPPSSAAVASVVEISLNGQQFTSSQVNYTYFVQPTMGDVFPLTTPLSGGTTVTVLGTGLLNYSTLACMLGGRTVSQATHVSTTQALCQTPPISLLWPTVSAVGLQTDFANAPASVILGGEAVVHGGVLKLTDASDVMHLRAGWVLTELPAPMPPLWDWRVSFELLIGGGSGGDGFSFLYGDMTQLAGLTDHSPITAFGEPTEAPFEGLQVKLYTKGKYIHVMYNDTTLSVFEVRDALRPQSWVQVDLVYDSHGLSLYIDGWSGWSEGQSTEQLHISGWNPQRGWQFAFAASTSRWSDYHWMDNLVIWSTWLVKGPAPYELQVTLNGQQFISTGVNITYLTVPAISVLTPKTGPAMGNTQLRVSGVNFHHGDHYTCRFFGDVVVQAELLSEGTLQCFTPSLEPSQISTSAFVSAPFAISLNNQDYTTDAIMFLYREPTIVSYINPDAGPSAGSSRVTVFGRHFAGSNGYRCKFGDGPPVVAELHGAKASGYFLECLSPALNASDGSEVLVPLEVTVNDQQYTTNVIPYRYFSQQSVDEISPSSGPILGDTSVLVRFSSAGSSSDSAFYCRFGTLLSVGAVVSNNVVACPSPVSFAPQDVLVSISTNAQQFSNLKEYTYYAHPTISSISPSSGPSQGGTRIDVIGKHMREGSDYVCQFGGSPTIQVDATFLSSPSNRVQCYSRPVPGSRTLALEVSLNAQQYSTDSHDFTFFNPPEILSLSPSTGPVKGGTRIQLSGVGFADGSHYLCRFTGPTNQAFQVQAVYLSDALSTCITPELSSSDTAGFQVQLSLNGQQFSDQSNHPIVFGFYNESNVRLASPSSGPITGATLVKLDGAHLANGSDYRCQFGATIVSATYSPVEQLVLCTAPSASVLGSVGLEISQNGQQYTESGRNFTYFGPVAVLSLDPVSGPRNGDSFVNVYSVGITGGTDYRCQFGNQLSIPASLVHNGMIACYSPPHNVSTQVVRIAANGQQYSPVGAEFFYYESNSVLSVSPSSGSSSGGTIITLVGAHFRSFVEHPIQCKVGEQLAETVLINESTLECVIPTATAAGVAQSVSIGFESIDEIASVSNVRLFGDAHVVNNLLELTPASPHQMGSVFFSLTPTDRPFRWFRSSVMVSTGGGERSRLLPEGGMGFSFNFGPLSFGPIGELGAGSGLRLCFLTTNATLTAHLEDRFLDQAALPQLGTDFFRVEIVYKLGMLHVLVRGELLLTLSSMSALEREDTRTWIVGIGARTGLRHDAHRVDNFTLESGAVLYAESVPVEVTQNDASYTADNIQFLYLPPPHVSRLSVDRGPITGLTSVLLYGSNFTGASHPLCRFGHIVVDGTVRSSERWPPMECVAPAHVQDVVSLEVSLNGKDYTSDEHNFSFYATSLVTVSPLGAPVGGGALLTLGGKGLDAGKGYNRYRCRLSDGRYETHVPGTYLPLHDRLRCITPRMPSSTLATLTVSLNGQQFTNDPLNLTIYNLSLVKVTPHHSIFDGGQQVVLSAKGAIPFENLACRFVADHGTLATSFNASLGVDRWYGTALAPATIGAGDTIRCVAPSAEEAGIARRLHLDFASPLPAGVAVMGSARVEGGFLKLTELDHHQEGALVLKATDPWPWRQFDLRFKVYVGDGQRFCTYDEAHGGRVCGGEGFSVSYGALPTTQLGQLGAGAGLRVIFFTAPRNSQGPTIDVMYANTRIHRSLLHEGWPKGVWIALRIQYGSHEGLSLEVENEPVFKQLSIANWQPMPEWRISLSAHTGLAVDNHWIDDLTFSTDALIGHQSVGVEVTVNGQQFTNDALTLWYDAPIVVSTFSPSTGPVSGLTRVRVRGHMFANGLQYSCRFGIDVVPALYNSTDDVIICPASPTHSSGNVVFAISLDGENWVTADLAFSYYAGFVSIIDPPSGPILGGTSILVKGSGLRTGSDYRCRFSEGMTFPDGPLLPNETTVMCVSPSFAVDGEYALRISLNGQQYSPALPFTAYPPPFIETLSPSSGPVVGGTVVTINGSNFAFQDTQICQFGPEPRGAQTSLGLSSVSKAIGPHLSSRECTSRTIEGVMLGAKMSLRHGVPLTNVSTFGTAIQCTDCHTGQAVITLTPPLPTSTGTVTIGVPHLQAPSLSFFHARLHLQLHNGQQSEGFSFSYASQIWDATGARGATASGLAISFLIWPRCKLRVYAHSYLLVDREFPSASWIDDLDNVELIIAADHQGLHISSHTLGLVLDGIHVDNWMPRHSWVVGIGASTGPGLSSYELMELAVEFGGHVISQHADVEISQNGQQFTRHQVAFTYYPAPMISSITPVHGPVIGLSPVVIAGAHFSNGTHYVCQFGSSRTPATFVPHTELIICYTPSMMPRADVAVTVSLSACAFSERVCQCVPG